MRILWENHLGKDPVLYARKVLKECGRMHPPICEKTVADYLGLEIKECSLDGLPQDEDLREALKTACAWLKREPGGKSYIGVYRDVRSERKRLGVFHECSHDIVPWHENLDYFCSEKDIGPTAHKRTEQEAFKCGAEFLMPRELFVEDAMSLETGISAIDQLRQTLCRFNGGDGDPLCVYISRSVRDRDSRAIGEPKARSNSKR